MATTDPAYAPQQPSSSEPGPLPYPTTDTPGTLPYPPTTDTAAVPGALPYPPTTTATPTMPYPSTDAYPPPGAAGSAPYPPQQQTEKMENNENKTYTDAPPPYSPPPGGVYPTSQGQMPPPQPGFVGYPSAHQMPPQSYPVAPGSVTVTTVSRTGQQQAVMLGPGTCPTCRVGVISENFTLLGICCAFWFFPLGIFCCLAMREKRCTSCGSAFA